MEKNTCTNYNENAVIRIHLINTEVNDAEGNPLDIWVSLPMDDIDLALDSICARESGTYAIVDYEAEIEMITIERDEKLDVLNEAAKKIEGMNNFEKAKLEAILECDSNDIAVAMENMENYSYDFWPNTTLDEMAEDAVAQGLFGDVSESLASYIDYAKIANDMSYDGYYETRNGVLHIS